MKVLHVAGWLAPRYGGSTFVTLQSAALLAERGHRVEVITTNVDGAGTLEVQTGRALEWGGVKATFHSLSPPRKFLTSWSMLADLNRRVAEFDVVHIHSLYRFHTLAAASIAIRRGVPYVLQPHGSLDPRQRAHRRRLKDAYHFLVEDHIIRRAAAVLCTSTHEELSFRDLGYGVPTCVIPVAVDAAELRAPAAMDDLLLRAGVDPAAQIITFLGRISEVKGVDLLLASFMATAAEFPAAHLIVAGPDDEGIGVGLSASITASGLSDRVSFIGTVDGREKRALLQRSDVFVLPSAHESFGIAVAEAMAVGCPVIVSPDVALADLIQAAGAGIVAEREAGAISRAIARILADRSAAKAMGVAGRRLVEVEFTSGGIATRLEALYRTVLAGPSSQAAKPSANARR